MTRCWSQWLGLLLRYLNLVDNFEYLYDRLLDLPQGAGHSGWEDALQSNQYHYLHHRFPFLRIATFCLKVL